MPSERSRDRKLTEDEVLKVALRLVESEGTDRFSMRKLADELGVTPMAIYRYVRNKEDLLQLVAADVCAQAAEGDEGGTWQERMLANAVNLWEVLTQYPGVATFLLNSPLNENDRRRVDYFMDMLRDAGFDRSTAEMAWETYHIYVYGLVALETRFRPGRRSTDARRRTVEFGLRVWLAGLEAQLATQPSV